MGQETDDTVKHVGLQAHRLNGEGSQSVLERAFAQAWGEKNGDLLAYLVGKNNQPGDVSTRDAQVAATVIQWLGSSVGQGFLEDVDARVAAKH